LTIADTDVLIDYLSAVNPSADRIAAELAYGSLATTAITRFDVLCGARNPRQKELIRELLALIPTLLLDEAAADRAAEIKRSLERSGTAIGMADTLIAGIVLVHSRVLLTRNRRHFERVAGLRIAAVSAQQDT